MSSVRLFNHFARTLDQFIILAVRLNHTAGGYKPFQEMMFQSRKYIFFLKNFFFFKNILPKLRIPPYLPYILAILCLSG